MSNEPTSNEPMTFARHGKRARLRTAVVAAAQQSEVRTVKMADGDTLTIDPATATASVEDPQGSVIGVLDADKPGPVRSGTAGEGHTWTYTLDQAMSTATVSVQHDGTTQHFGVTKPGRG
ncbi:hypothetical protein A6A06_13880 [Streptomyces sp. CB02923]|uniref:hypothetical protein n=1 Tax=Streptomyces sp. CB02923 TaxID=1718985 RepID=UPI00093FCD42|nr:hypothetical protein [Streptomyces sp. CB02923]OKI02162.1 hypothetical protein A6A06_13880 [Streptomyces sp. CB02923]